jgi:uncharacterized membrane protein
MRSCQPSGVRRPPNALAFTRERPSAADRRVQRHVLRRALPLTVVMLLVVTWAAPSVRLENRDRRDSCPVP